MPGAPLSWAAAAPPGRSRVIHIHGTADINGPAFPLLNASWRPVDLDLPSTALNATQVSWRFFAAHPR